MRTILITILFSLLNLSTLRAAVNAEWYSEHALLNREQILSSLIRVRAQHLNSTVFTPYLQLGSELSEKLEGRVSLNNGSYGYLAPGLKIKLAAIQLWSEARIRQYYKGIAGDTLDARQYAILNLFYDQPLRVFDDLKSFQEVYSENIYSSADKHNLTTVNFVRIGIRKPLSKSAHTDLFLEPFVTFDRLGHFYNNRADVKASLRIQNVSTQLNLSLTASLLYNTYFSYANLERNPYLDKNWGVRILLVAGGAF